MTNTQARKFVFPGSLLFCNRFIYFPISGLAFANAGTYDPYNFGKKLQRFYNCDIYLTDANFEELVVDLEVVLILQPLIRRRPGINNCDQPLITRQTVRIEFEGYQSTVCYHLLGTKEILESFLFCMYLGSFTLPYLSTTKLNEYS